jgi:predicted transcriptional regulator
VAVVVCSFVVQVCEQKSFRYSFTPQSNHVQVHSGYESLKAITINEYCLLGFSPSFNIPAVIQNPLENATRNSLFSYIDANPGMQFRAICSALCLPIGLAEYHLGVLVRAGLVSFVRDGRYKRFFVSGKFTKRQMQVIALLRHSTVRRIVETLMVKRQLSHCRLAGEVAISSQALTWHMKAIQDDNFVVQTDDGLKTMYSLDERSIATFENCLYLVR